MAQQQADLWTWQRQICAHVRPERKDDLVLNVAFLVALTSTSSTGRDAYVDDRAIAAALGISKATVWRYLGRLSEWFEQTERPARPSKEGGAGRRARYALTIPERLAASSETVRDAGTSRTTTSDDETRSWERLADSPRTSRKSGRNVSHAHAGTRDGTSSDGPSSDGASVGGCTVAQLQRAHGERPTAINGINPHERAGKALSRRNWEPPSHPLVLTSMTTTSGLRRLDIDKRDNQYLGDFPEVRWDERRECFTVPVHLTDALRAYWIELGGRVTTR